MQVVTHFKKMKMLMIIMMIILMIGKTILQEQEIEIVDGLLWRKDDWVAVTYDNC